MLLSQEQRNYFQKNFFQLCHEEGFGTNTWTIDLCYLLKRFEISHRMHTTRRAVNCKYSGSRSNIIIKNADRVRNRFENASAKGIEVVDGALSTQELIEHVSSTGPAIVLVDGPLLSCDLCKHNKFASELRSIFGGLYRGHYVLVVGTAGKLVFRDPARAVPECVTPPHRLHTARRAHGTDYDVILIYNKYNIQSCLIAPQPTTNTSDCWRTCPYQRRCIKITAKLTLRSEPRCQYIAPLLKRKRNCRKQHTTIATCSRMNNWRR